MIGKVAVCFLLCAFSSASHAQLPDAKCKDSAYVSSQVEQIKSALARVVDAVEMVPPDEAEYIRSEARKALQQQK